MLSRHTHPGTGTRADSIEFLNTLFARIGTWSYDHRWIVAAVCVLLLALCAVFASRVRFDNSFAALFDRNDPTYRAYLQFREDFGSDEVSYIVYDAPDFPHGPWNLEVMRKIEALTEALEDEVPFVQEVTSLVNVEFLVPIPDGIRIHDLLDDFPESQEALLEIKRNVLAKPLYVGGLASADGKHAAVIVDMDRSSIDPLQEIQVDPAQGVALANLYPQATYSKIEEILSRPEYAGINFHHTGDVPLNAVYNLITSAETWWLGTICAAIIGATLLFFFRRAIGVLGPLAVVTLSVFMTVALLGVLDWPLDLTFGMLPTLLIAVGVADSVHIISEFRAYHVELGDRRQAARRTMYLVGTPCLLTSLTTAAGFGSMAVSPIKAVAHFAVCSAAGVLVAFVLSVTLLLVFLSLGRRTLPRAATARERLQAKGGHWFQNGLGAVAQFDIRHRRGILLFSAAVFVVSALGIGKLRVDSNFLTDFSEEVPIRRITTYVDDTMGGTGSFIYLFDAGVPESVKQPEVLREIERVQAEAERHTELVRKTYSMVHVMKDINRTFHDGDLAYDALPDSRELVAQYLLLYESSGGEEVEEYVSSDYSRANLELRCRLAPSSRLAQMTTALDVYLQNEPLQASTVTVTGIGALWVKLMDYITETQIRGFLLAFTVIAAMLCFLFRSLQIGLLSMIPNLSPVLLTIGGMGWFGIPLDYMRLFIGTVAIGIAVDNTIHLVTRYHHEFVRRGNYTEALDAAMRDVGRALFITSAVLVLGFLVFLFSVMDSQTNFGVLLASTIVTALVANFFLMPALVLTFEPFGAERQGLRPSDDDAQKVESGKSKA